jgi:hypothetical protein
VGAEAVVGDVAAEGSARRVDAPMRSVAFADAWIWEAAIILCAAHKYFKSADDDLG